jgi:hypothetical protein
VFSYLVIPAVVAMLFAERISTRLVIGWITGTVVSAVGCSVSYFRDLPSGPAIVACFGVFLVLAGLVSFVTTSADKGRALIRAAAGMVLLALLIGGSFALRKREHHDTLHVLQTGNKAEKMLALAEIEADADLWERTKPLVSGILASGENEVRLRLLGIVEARKDKSVLPAIEGLLLDKDDSIAERSLRVVRALGDPRSADVIANAARKEDDDYLRVEMAEALLELGDARGLPLLVDVICGDGANQARREAWEHLAAHVDVPVKVDVDLAADDKASGVPDLQAWWKSHASTVKAQGGGRFQVGS